MEVDWWSKYYASRGETDKCMNYVDEGYDTLQVRSRSLNITFLPVVLYRWRHKAILRLNLSGLGVMNVRRNKLCWNMVI